MGIYTDLASSTQFGPKPRVGLDRSSAEQLLGKAQFIDPTVRPEYAAADNVVVYAEQTDSAATDTYTLTVEFFGALKGLSFTTAAIAYNAVASAIESAIDTAATGVVPGWTNGDISVAMGGAAGLDDGTITLTFDGTSVTETPATVTLTPTGFTLVGSANGTRTGGQGDRKALMALFELNVVSGTVHAAGDEPTDWVRPASTGQSRPRYDLIRGLAVLASQEDGTDHVFNKVKALYPGI